MAKSKSGTVSTVRKHTFTSFRDKVDSIKIDPIRRVRKRITDYAGQSSYFITAFDHWSELNISANFSLFSQQCSQYCQSLPQVIHFQNEIMDLLEKYIQVKDEHSLESLLDLVTHFAHDLGPDFEPYFGRALKLLIELASEQNVAIVEWTFNCFAYLFKYLSRLLTTDLRPTYDAVSVLFGKESHQRKFVSRFAAESVSFLVRKCTGESLNLIIDHIINDVIENENEEFVNSAATLFSDAVKSSGNNLHSRTGDILNALFSGCEKRVDDSLVVVDLLSGVLVQLLHHIRQETSGAVYENAYKFIDEVLEGNDKISENHIILLETILRDLSGLRKGSRVVSWPPLLIRAQKVIDIISKEDLSDAIIISTLSLSTALFQSADFESTTKYYSPLVQQLYNLFNEKHFLAFCESIVNSNLSVFASHLLQYVQRYIKEFGKANITRVYLFLIKLESVGLLNRSLQTIPGKLSIVSESEFAKEVESVVVIGRLDSIEDFYNLFISLDTIVTAVIPSKNLIKHLPKLLKRILSLDTSYSPWKKALSGKILNLDNQSTIANELYDLIKDNLKSLCDSQIFLQGLLNLFKSNKSLSISHNDAVFIIKNISASLKSPSHDTRYITLQLISSIYQSMGSEVPKLINDCKLIEEIPLDLSNARNLSLYVRNVSNGYASTGSDKLLELIIPTFLFGLLTVKFQPAWEASIDAIAKISEKDTEIVWNLAYEWLSYENKISEVNNLFNDIFLNEPSNSKIECTNLKQVINSSSDLFDKYNHDEDYSKLTLRSKLETFDLPITLRIQIIKVLIKLPRIAERHNKFLVPFFLWDINEEEDTDEVSGSPLSSTWSVKERIALLELFSKFENPGNIYKWDEVYQRYLYLLGNRSSNVQKLALKCLLTLKNPQLRKYRDNLEALLDETQFKDELANLIRYSGQEGTIHEDDRAEVLPIVTRIIFGRSQIAKSGGVKQTRRFAIINSLSNVESEYIKLFIELSANRLDHDGFLTGSYDEKVSINNSFTHFEPSDNKLRRELGFVTMLEDIVENLRDRVIIAWDTIIESLLLCLFRAYKVKDEENDQDTITSKNTKSIRAIGFKCLNSLMSILPDANWYGCFDIIYDNFISPKMDKFAEDNLQQPSSLMRLFVTLSSENSLSHLLAWDDCTIIKSFFSCVNYDEVKDAVVDVIMDTMKNILELGITEDAETLSLIGAPIVLNRMPYLFDRQSNSQLLEKEANLLVKLMTSGYEATDDIRKQLIEVSLSALEKSTTLVKITVKASLLQTLSLLLMDGRSTIDECRSAYNTLSKLFRQFSNRHARQNLARVFEVFGEQFDIFSTVSKLVVELNSYSSRRIDTPDFDRRLAAFADINEKSFHQLSALEWLPLLYNMLYFMRDPEELALRTNATYSIKRFIDCMSLQENEEKAAPYVELLETVILPVLKTSLRDSNEIFRSEFVEVLGHLVKVGKWYTNVDDMKCLLFDGDEEANFFNNINHLQFHRRRRAVARLAKLANGMKLSDTSIAHYLLPIIEQFVGITEGEGHSLAEDCIKCIGVLSSHLTWNQYRGITKRYVSYLNSRPEKIRSSIRLIETVSSALINISETPEVEDDEEGEEDGEDGDITMKSSNDITNNITKGAVKLSECLPSTDKLSIFITEDIVPTMQKVLNKRNDDEDLTLRIPLVLPIVKFIKALPEELIELKLPGVLTGLCQILRAKSQELRDMIRNTLGKVAKILGPKYFVFIIKELKGALRRGAQLHILGYSLHSLLVEMKPAFEPRDLDSSASLIMDIIMEDTFGTTGGEKDEEGYTTDMKEVKQHKSYDSGEILSSNVSLGTFSELIEPVKTLLLYERLNLKMERKVEELLRRFALGLYHNIDGSKQEVLVMCFELHEMINDVTDKAEKEKEIEKDVNFRDEQKKIIEQHFEVKLDSRRWNEKNTLKVGNLHILTRFIFETIRTVLGKNEHLTTAENVAGFMPMLEIGLEGNYEDVQIATLRLLALIIKLPIPDITERISRLGSRTLWLIKSCANTNSDLCQGCLRFLSVVIRQKKDFSLKESELAYVLNRIKPDIEEPERQAVTLTFIKSVLSRQIMIPEVYDIMDKVAEVMVTNSSNITRDACRSAYFQFLTEYPQGKGRLTKQLKFLVANLEYPAISGRLSVMEIIHLLLAKVTTDQIQEVTTSFFVALVLVLINDEEVQCRETAAAIIGELLDIAEEEQLKLIEEYCTKWLGNNEQELLLRGGFQVSGIYFAKLGIKQSPSLFKLAVSKVERLLEKSKSDSNTSVNWETLYQSLQFIAKVTQNNSSSRILFSSEYQKLWDLIEASLLFPHSWVRLVSSRLMGKLYSVYSGGKNCGIIINRDNLQSTAFKFIRQLGASSISEEFGVQIVKNLVFICMQWNSSEDTIYFVKHKEDDEEDEEEVDVKDKLPAIHWVVQKASSVLRTEKNFNEKIVSKKASVQLLASIIQLVSIDQLKSMAEDIIMAFYIYSTSEDEKMKDLHDLSLEALNMIQKKLGTTDYIQAYSNVQQTVATRRIERKSKRAIQAVSAPDVFARKKLRKNLVKREKRKNVRDENGYYHSKKNRTM